jgi:IMP dehydrogenase
MAQEGGIGIVHKNMTIAEQAAEVARVKKFESGVIRDPITVAPDMTIRQVIELTRSKGISGVPVVQGSKVVGIVTHSDLRFEVKLDAPVSTVMTPKERLVTVRENAPKDEVLLLLHKHRIEKVLVVNSDQELRGMITVKDFQKATEFPRACKDPSGRLRVGAAVGTAQDTLERVAALREAGVDVVVVDTAHGHSKGVLEAVQRIKSAWKDLPVFAGNVVTAEGTEALIKAGADAIKVGVGAGSICTTRVISGAGMPQVSAIFECSRAAQKHGVSVIADGGIKFSGDIVKAIVAGGNAVMLGSMLAGLEEAPGEVMMYEGRRFKEYRGMGSLGAMKGYGVDRYATGQSGGGKLVPEGIEGRVPYKGALGEYVYQLVGGLRSGMGYAGAASLSDLSTKTRLTRITNAGLIESHPHDVIITKEAPNYQLSQR